MPNISADLESNRIFWRGNHIEDLSREELLEAVIYLAKQLGYRNGVCIIRTHNNALMAERVESVAEDVNQTK